jgi:hypothetical protein
VFELLHLPWIFLLLLLVHLSFSFPWLPSSIFILLEVFKLMYLPFYFPRLLLYHFLDFQFSSFSSLLFSPIMSKILEKLSILIPFSFSHFIFLMNVSYFAPHHMWKHIFLVLNFIFSMRISEINFYIKPMSFHTS